MGSGFEWIEAYAMSVSNLLDAGSKSGHQQPDMGAESVTALLETKGDQTEVHGTTCKGFYGRLAKKNWSTPIYEAMMKNLQSAQP